MGAMWQCKRLCARVCGTNEEDDVSVEVDAELDAVDDLLPGPARNPKVGDQSHHRHREKPERRQARRFRITKKKHIKREDVGW